MRAITRPAAIVSAVALLVVGGLIGRSVGHSTAYGEEIGGAAEPRRAVIQASFDQARWWLRNSAPPVWPIVFSMKLDRLEHVPGSCTTNRQHADVAPADIDWVATISARSFSVCRCVIIGPPVEERQLHDLTFILDLVLASSPVAGGRLLRATARPCQFGPRARYARAPISRRTAVSPLPPLRRQRQAPTIRAVSLSPWPACPTPAAWTPLSSTRCSMRRSAGAAK